MPICKSVPSTLLGGLVLDSSFLMAYSSPLHPRPCQRSKLLHLQNQYLNTNSDHRVLTPQVRVLHALWHHQDQYPLHCLLIPRPLGLNSRFSFNSGLSFQSLSCNYSQTMFPSLLCCFCFILAWTWVTESLSKIKQLRSFQALWLQLPTSTVPSCSWRPFCSLTLGGWLCILVLGEKRSH